MRLTWQVVALILGAMASWVVVACKAADVEADARRLGLGLYAIDHGLALDEDGNVLIPGDAEDGTFPDTEA